MEVWTIYLQKMLATENLRAWAGNHDRELNLY